MEFNHFNLPARPWKGDLIPVCPYRQKKTLGIKGPFHLMKQSITRTKVLNVKPYNFK